MAGVLSMHDSAWGHRLQLCTHCVHHVWDMPHLYRETTTQLYVICLLLQADRAEIQAVRQGTSLSQALQGPVCGFSLPILRSTSHTAPVVDC